MGRETVGSGNVPTASGNGDRSMSELIGSK